MSGGASASSDTSEQPPPRRGFAGFAARAIVSAEIRDRPGLDRPRGGGDGEAAIDLGNRRRRGADRWSRRDHRPSPPRPPPDREFGTPALEPQRRRRPGSPWPAGVAQSRAIAYLARLNRRPQADRAACWVRFPIPNLSPPAGDAGERHRGARTPVPRSGARYRQSDGTGGPGSLAGCANAAGRAAPRRAARFPPRPRDGRWSRTACRWWRSS